MDHTCRYNSGEKLQHLAEAAWPFHWWQGPVALWWKTCKCGCSVQYKAPGVAFMRPSIHSYDRLRCTRTSKPQRSQRDPDRSQSKVLDHEKSKFSEIHNPSLCFMSQIWRSRIPCSTPTTITWVQSQGGNHYRCWLCQSALHPFNWRVNKVWICLFTCCVTRAIHLNIVTNLSTETFLRCLKRFAVRRGMPRKFVSDNGKTFKAAAKFIKAVFKDNVVLEHLSGLGVEWKFNLEKAPARCNCRDRVNR